MYHVAIQIKYRSELLLEYEIVIFSLPLRRSGEEYM